MKNSGDRTGSQHVLITFSFPDFPLGTVKEMPKRTDVNILCLERYIIYYCILANLGVSL